MSIPTWNERALLRISPRRFHNPGQPQAQHPRKRGEALNAEKLPRWPGWAAIAYPGDELTEDWKRIAFNEFHDLAAGSGIGVIYKEAQKDYDMVRLETGAVRDQALATIAAHVNTAAAPGEPLLVFNPLAWDRSGTVEVTVQMPAASRGVSILDVQGHVLPSQVLSFDPATNRWHLLVDVKSVPSLGYQVLHAVPGSRAFASDLKASGVTLENAALRVVVDPVSGCITSLFDKRSQFESLAQGACGNALQAYRDLPTRFDAWNIDPGTLDAPPLVLPPPSSVKLIETGPLRSVIRVTRIWDKSRFVQDITLYEGAGQVEVVNDIDWHADHVLLKAAFPLAASGPSATYEIPYGSITRPTTRLNSWDKAQFEVPALRWADLGDGRHGFSLINESKYGYDAAGNVLRLSLLRAPTWPDPDADRGHHHFRYALMPHGGDWKQALTVRHGYEFNYGLAAFQVTRHGGALPPSHAFVALHADNVVLTAMKKAEDSNALELHLYEWAGRGGDVDIAMPPGAVAATETDLMEKPLGTPLAITGGHVHLPVRPYEIAALRFDYPHAP